MYRGVAWSLGLLLMIPGIAGAGELRVGARTDVGYDSNVFSRGEPQDIDSFVWRLNAWGEVEDELERGSYRVRYSPTFFFNADSSADNVWNHNALAEGELRFSPRTSLQATNQFQFLEKIIFQPDSDVPSNPNVDDGNRRTTRNQSRLTLTHAFTPRLSSYAGGEYEIFRFDRSQDEDNETLSGFAGMNYLLRPTWRVGFGGNVSYRAFDANQNAGAACAGEDGPGARSFSYSGFLSVAHQFDELTSIEFRAGPARVETTNFLCVSPTMPIFSKQEVNQTTWFAQGQASRKWSQQFETQASYRRSQGLGGVGNTTINDQVFARMIWKPLRLWRFNVRAGWIRRTQKAARNPVTRVRVNNDTTTYTVAAGVSRQILRRLRAGLQASYRDQAVDRDVSNPLGLPPAFLPADNSNVNDFDAWTVFAFLTYEFDPYRY